MTSAAPRRPSTFNATFRRTLGAEDKNQRTVKSYTEAVGLLTDFLAERDHLPPVAAITRADVGDCIAEQFAPGSPPPP